VPAVFVFDCEGDLNVFPSLETASGWIEAVDVDNGEYAAAFLHDGTVVQMSTLGERVVLTPSDTRDTLQLQQFLDSYQRRGGRPISDGSVLGFADDWLREEWEHRWPKRPAWLARRLHGAEPPQASDDLR
jgi:hypothetical protein